MGRLGHRRRTTKEWCQICGEVSGTCSHTRPATPREGRSPTWGMGGAFELGEPRVVGPMPVRTDLEVLPADEPQQVRLGWTVNETVGIAVANSRGVSRLAIDTGDPRPTRDTIIDIIRNNISQFLLQGTLINTLMIAPRTYARIQAAYEVQSLRMDGQYTGHIRSMLGVNIRVNPELSNSVLMFAEERTNRATTFYPVEIV